MIFPVGRFCQKLFDKLWDGELATLSQFHRSKSNSQQDDGADEADNDIDEPNYVDSPFIIQSYVQYVFDICARSVWDEASFN